MPNSPKQALQLRLLNELSTKLQGLLQSDDFYQEIVDIIQSHFHYYSIHIWSVNADPTYTLQAQAGAHRSHLKIGHTISVREGIIGAVIRSGKSYLCDDVRKDPNYISLDIPVDTRSELCVPILTPTTPDAPAQVMATLNIESDKSDTFDEDDVITLESLASQVSVAMANQRLYADAMSFNKKLRAAVDEKTKELRHAQERIMEQQRLLQKENKILKALVNHGQTEQQKANETIGASPAVLNLMAMVDKIAPTTATVLIQGESGTGKELVARRLHFKSERANKPFVTVNCGALQESLLESELFGHEKGSFTGAVAQKIGLAETADGGTLFLDEIGEMSPAIQAKLLRFLQEGEFYRIGGKRPIKVNVRVVSATNRDLEQEVRNNRFREDLYYRLNTITLRMPPLRKRKEDIPQLVEHFLKNSRFGGPGQQIKKIDPRVMEVFQNYDWPGNIRELQNTIERMKILSDNNEMKIEDVPANIRMPKARQEGSNSDFSIDMPLEDVEKTHILRTLAYCQGNKTKAAQSLGITIKTLYNKLHRYGMPVGPTGPSEQDQASVI